MNKLYGFRGSSELIPKDVNESFSYDKGIEFSIHDGIIEVGYDNVNDESDARVAAEALIAGWSIRNQKLDIDFNQSWKSAENGHRAISVSLSENMTVTDRVATTTVHIKGLAYIVTGRSDTAGFAQDVYTALKAKNDQALALALKYLHDEGLDRRTSAVGIHKAIEQLTITLGSGNISAGRTKLAQLAGVSRQYVDELMESVQEDRHSRSWLSRGGTVRKIDDAECLTRAKTLISRYADSLT